MENNEISGSERHRLIYDSIVFIRAVTEIYGAEEGMQLWEKISEVLDPKLKGDIFFSIISGEHENRVTIQRIIPNSSKVDIVKAFRSVDIRELDLRDAKIFADRLFNYEGTVTIQLKPGERSQYIKQLRDAGCVI